MAKCEEVSSLVKGCLANAERLIESATAVLGVPGCAHIAYNLAIRAFEEIGKSALIFQDSLDPQPPPREREDEHKTPSNGSTTTSVSSSGLS
jgi:AbiV family abortive infection protein